MSVPLVALTALESLVNPLLHSLAAQEGLTAAHLHQLQGRVFEVRLAPWGTSLYVQVEPEGLFLHRHWEEAPDAWIEATPQAYLKMATHSVASGALFSADVHIGGDTQQLETLQALLAGLGLDAQEVMMRLTAALPFASQAFMGLQAGAGQLLRWGQRARQAARTDLHDYLDDETGSLPGQNSLHLLQTDLDCLRLDVDRVEARLRLLEAAVEGESQ